MLHVGPAPNTFRDPGLRSSPSFLPVCPAPSTPRQQKAHAQPLGGPQASVPGRGLAQPRVLIPARRSLAEA